MHHNNKYLLGWLSGDGRNLYVYRNIPEDGWGVTYNITEAYKFSNPEECLNFYIGVHAYKDDAIQWIRDGAVLISDGTGSLIHPLLYTDLRIQ